MTTQLARKRLKLKMLEARLRKAKIPGDDLADKLLHFYLQCQNFADFHSTPRGNTPSIYVQLDPAAAYDVFVSAYIDIARYKSHHLHNPKQQRSDGVKRAAYFTKWLTRLRPFSAVRTPFVPEDPDPALWFNELFAVEQGFHQISNDASIKNKKKITWILNDEQDTFEFLYDLHYRQLHDDALLAFFQMHAYMADGKAVGRSL